MRAPFPNLSVLVPTRNRPALARLAVASALRELGPDGQVVLADNGDEPIALDRSDPRLTVVRAGRVLSMPDNWEQALLAARGEWVLCLSDKCRLVPGALAALDAARGDAEIVTYQRTTFVQDLPLERSEDEAALLSAPGALTRMRPPPVVRERSSREALREWYREGGYRHLLPMLFNTVVRRAVLDRGRRRMDRYFYGCSPDIGSGLLMCAETERYVDTTLVGTTIQYPGRSLARWSTGNSFTSGAKTGRASFIGEFGGSPMADYGLPDTGIGGITETLLRFRDARPDLRDELDLCWEQFALLAASQIEGYREGRLPLHLQTLLASQRDGLRPRAALLQAKVIAAVRLPRLQRAFAALRRQLQPPPAEAPPRELVTEERSLEAALSTLARENRGAEARRPQATERPQPHA